MKIVFMGTPDFALTALRELQEKSEHKIVCVYTRAPKPKGRGNKITKSPVHEYAEANGIEVRTPLTLRNSPDEWRALRDLNADIIVVAAYGLILPKEVIEACPYGAVNIHGSLLPKWRGAAPIERSMMALDDETGVTIMQIDEGLDSGDMIMKESVAIDDAITSAELRNKLAETGASLLVKALTAIAEGTAKKEKQPANYTIAPKIEKAERLLDFTDAPRKVLRKIKAIGGYFMYKNEIFNIIDAELVPCDSAVCGKIMPDLVISLSDGKGLRITKIQRQGKNAMDAKAFLCGFKFDADTVLL